MQTYRDFRPTGFDSRGAFLDADRQDWLVVPVGRNRDSGPLDESNFAAACGEMPADGPEDTDRARCSRRMRSRVTRATWRNADI